MGRHTSAARSARLGALGVIAVLLSIPALNALLSRDTSREAHRLAAIPACDHTLRVVTASSFAPVLGALAATLGRGADCVRLYTSVTDGRDALDAVTRRKADLWIPDDASWAAGADGLAPKAVANRGAVLATSPIYMVTDRSTAERIDSADGSWAALAGLLTPKSGVRLAVADPAGSGDGLVAAGDLGEAVWLAKDMDASAMALATARTVTRTVTGPEPALPIEGGEVGLVPEYALLRGGPPGDSVALLGGTDHTALLRYTWLPTAASVADPERAASLSRLLRTLIGPEGARAIAAAKLRTPVAAKPESGVSTMQAVSPAGAPPPGVPRDRLPMLAAAPFKPLGAHHVDHVFASWYPADRRANLLLVVDVSGSMADPAPGTKTPLIKLVSQGCASVGKILPDDASLGLWEFGSRLVGARDYRPLVRTSPLEDRQRAAVGQAIRRLAARDTGTGLYDTILAAYTAATDAYQPGVPNQVLVFTDGRNEDDPGSISAAQLSERLEAVTRKDRPVHLAVVAFGSRPEVAVVEKALKPVDGYVDPVRSADEVAAAFVHVAAGGLHEED